MLTTRLFQITFFETKQETKKFIKPVDKTKKTVANSKPKPNIKSQSEPYLEPCKTCFFTKSFIIDVWHDSK